MPCALAAAALLLAANGAAAPPTLPIYIGGGGAPPALAQRVDERLRSILGERVSVVSEPQAPPAGTTPETRLAEARRDLERGVKAYQMLALDEAVPALQSAETRAFAAAGAPPAAAVLAEARTHLGLIALATGKTSQADAIFRSVAALDPDRRLDGRIHPPEVVAAYEKARRAVAAGPQCDLTLAAAPAGATITVNGKPASGTVRLPYGEHLVQASVGEIASAGQKVELSQARALVSVEVPVGAAFSSAIRAAARRGDEAAVGAAADALAAAAGAKRVLLWDLRSANGRVEAPMRMRDAVAKAFTWQVNADLGTAASPDAALRRAVTEILEETPTAVPVAIPQRPKKPAEMRRLPPWVWWAAGGVALAAAGGAAAYTMTGSREKPGDEVVVVVDK